MYRSAGDADVYSTVATVRRISIVDSKHRPPTPGLPPPRSQDEQAEQYEPSYREEPVRASLADAEDYGVEGAMFIIIIIIPLIVVIG